FLLHPPATRDIYSLSLHDALPILHKKHYIVDINQILTYEAALDLNATTTEVKERFSLLQVTHLPIVQDTKFLGCISLDNMDSLEDRKSTRLNSSHVSISYAVFCLK